MNAWGKLIRGDALRPSRLHTEAHIFCGLDALPGLFPAGWTWMRARLTGHRIVKPWWVWNAIRFVERELRPTDRVLEVGSGYSTIWLAQRCAKVVSIEESPQWRAHVEQNAQLHGLTNIKLESGGSLQLFRQMLSQNRWDVVVIDGPNDRLEIFRHLLSDQPEKHPRMVIYDNTDRLKDREAPSLSEANNYCVKTFRGFAPQTVHATETAVFLKGNLTKTT